MRRWFLILMLVLLPLRGWAGLAMGLEMSAAATSAAVMASASVADARMAQADHAPCHGEEVNAGQGQAASPASQHGDCNTCTSCQACSAVAIDHRVASLPALPLPTAQPLARASCFASAVPALGLKPPIS